LHRIALHCIALHRIALHRIASHCIALHSIASHCIALHRIASHCIALHHIASHCIALHRIASHCIALHCIALHRIALSLCKSSPLLPYLHPLILSTNLSSTPLQSTLQKGTPAAPQCGFSMQAVRILNATGADFASVNVLEYSAIREAVKVSATTKNLDQEKSSTVPAFCPVYHSALHSILESERKAEGESAIFFSLF
jgi:hypothetical protein